jgi:hypothetical protein
MSDAQADEMSSVFVDFPPVASLRASVLEEERYVDAGSNPLRQYLAGSRGAVAVWESSRVNDLSESLATNECRLAAGIC